MRIAALPCNLCLAAVAAVGWVGLASALPPGRAWTPVTRFSIPGFQYVVTPRLELAAPGEPFLITRTGIPNNVFRFDWADSAWVQRWRFDYAAIHLWPVQSPPGTHHLVWRGFGPIARERLFMAEVLEDGIATPDTVTRVLWGIDYSGAVSVARRWAVVHDVVANQRKLRILYSDTTAVWHEVPTERFHDLTDGVAVAPIGDTTALVAWSETFRLRWGILEGTRWSEGSAFGDRALRMHFRRRPSGGQWLAAGAFVEGHVGLRSFRDGVWSEPESLHCAYRDGLTAHYAGNTDLSRDDGEYPVIVWDAQNVRANNTICVSVPTDAGYGVAEELEGVEGDLGLPTAARDRNGDVWVAWFVMGDDVRWLHSYNRATTSTPRVVGAGRSRRVEWTLSEPAPETWWAVLRARGRDDFEEVARLRADQNLEMSWADTSPPAGLLRYKIRRESVDKRYLWESPMAHWPERIRRLALQSRGAIPFERQATLELENAAPGRYELRLHDVQGRIVHRQHGYASGTGSDAVALDLTTAGHLSNGMYFAAASDASGNVSPAIRLVILR